MQQLSQTPPSAAPAAASPLTSLLSQYELLTILCENLSSADIVHLGATSKEHWQYVRHNLKSLIADSTCDGKGIIAQARVFGHWQANPDNATRKCRGKDAEPCSGCGAMVCNMCRYHLMYASQEANSEPEDNDTDWDYEEMCIGIDVNSTTITEEDVTTHVELAKAISMMDYRRFETHCDECEPLLVPTTKSSVSCSCTVYSRFVRQWLCIPCFLVEETKFVIDQQSYTMEHLPHQTEDYWVYQRKFFCKCGKRESDQSMETCRWCGKIIGYNSNRDGHILKRIRQQLGSLTDIERRDDPVLSQLG